MSRDEVLDVVDKKDRLTGKTVRYSLSHKSYIPHRVTGVLVFRPDGRLLVQEHKHHNRLLDHSVGGHVSAGETYEEATRREMQEELGLDLPLNKIAGGVVSEEAYPNGLKLVHLFGVFSANAPKDWQFKETEEVDRLVEMTVEELVKGMNSEPDKFLQGFMTTMGAYLASIGSKQKVKAYGKTWGVLK